MRFKIETDLRDGTTPAAPLTVDFADIDLLLAAVGDEVLEGDEGVGVPVGATITLTREN